MLSSCTGGWFRCPAAAQKPVNTRLVQWLTLACVYTLHGLLYSQLGSDTQMVKMSHTLFLKIFKMQKFS